MNERRPSRLFLGALMLATALHPISVQMFLPALPAIQQAFGVSAGTAQLALSASMLAIGFATLAYGPLSDRFGRRPVLIAGQALFVLGSVGCWMAPHVTALIAARVVQACGACAGMVLLRAIVRDAYPAARVTSVLAYFTLAMAVFPMFTPAIGGVLIDRVHWRAIFAFASVVGAVSLLAVAARVWETRPEAPEAPRASLRSGMGGVARDRSFWGYALAGGGGSAAFFGFISVVPYLVIEEMGRPASEYGLWFVTLALAFMAGSLLAARVSERVGRDRMIALSALGMLLAGCAIAGLYAVGFWHPAALFGPGMLLTFAQGSSGPNAQAGAVSGDPAHAGAASGGFGFLQTLLAAAAAQVAGMLQDGTPLPMAGCVLATAGVALAAVLLLPRRREGAPGR